MIPEIDLRQYNLGKENISAHEWRINDLLLRCVPACTMLKYKRTDAHSVSLEIQQIIGCHPDSILLWYKAGIILLEGF